MAHNGLPGADDEALAYVGWLLVNGRQEVVKRSTHPVQLIDKVENDTDALVVDAEVALQIVDQLRSRDVSLGKMLLSFFPATHQPTGRNPSLQRFGLKVNTTKKFAMLHVSSPQLQPSCHLGRSATGS